MHVLSELSVPGGSIDYFVVSVKNGKVRDFVGIELQTLDTTGTVWPERQRFLGRHGIRVTKRDVASPKSFGINWKMTAKTALVQLHHKIETFEHISKHLVLVVQDHLHEYMKRQFSFDHLTSARVGDPMHMHVYNLQQRSDGWYLNLAERLSTDAEGIATCLGLQVEAKVELVEIINLLESKLSEDTLFQIE